MSLSSLIKVPVSAPSDEENHVTSLGFCISLTWTVSQPPMKPIPARDDKETLWHSPNQTVSLSPLIRVPFSAPCDDEIHVTSLGISLTWTVSRPPMKPIPARDDKTCVSQNLLSVSQSNSDCASVSNDTHTT